MSERIWLTGMVLSSSPFDDYDRRLVILTKERGKIVAFAKGARRQGSALQAGTQPFTMANFQLVEGRTAYNLVSLEGIRFFHELSKDVVLTCYACYMCEFAEHMTEENNDESQILKLLYQSMRALTNEKIGPKLTRVIFALKMMYLNGEGPQTEECVRCKRKEGEFVFSVRNGGCVCRRCAGDDFDPAVRREKELRLGIADNDFFNLSNAAWYTIRYIGAVAPEKLFHFTVNESVLEELTTVTDAFVREYVKHSFNSLAFLEVL